MAVNVVPAPTPGVPAQLVAYRRRLDQARRVRYLGWAALGVGAVWALAAVSTYFGPAAPGLLLACLLLTGLLPGAALLAVVAHRPSLMQTAAWLDARLDNQQRLVTAAELTAAPNPSALAAAQLATSRQILAAADPRTVAPVRVPWSLWGAGAGLLCLALALFLLRNGGFTPLQPGSLPPEAPLAAALSPTPVGGLPNAAQPPLADAPDAGDNPTGGDATDATSKAAASQDAQNGLQRLAQALEEQSVTQQAGDSLQQGNVDQAAQQLAQVGQESDQLSNEAKRDLADSLRRAAEDSGATPDLRRAEQQAASALNRGDYKEMAQALQNLGEAAQRTADNVVPQQQLAKDFPEPTAPPADSPPSDPSQQGQQGQGQQGQGGQASSGGDQSGGSPPGQGQGQQGDSGGQGQTDGTQAQGGGAGTGSRVSGPSDPDQLNVAGNPFELESRPQPGTTKPGDPNQQPGVTLGSGSGSAGAAAPDAPGSAETTAGESHQAPVERWPVIQRYFSPGP